MTEIKEIVNRDYQCDKEFIKAHSEYFPYYDTNNSERVYAAIKVLHNSKEL